MRHFIRIFLLALAGFCIDPSARAVTINISYDASVTNQSFFTNVVSALAAVTNTYHMLFTNTSTLNISCYWGNVGPFSGGVQLSESTAQELGQIFNYKVITNALAAARSSANATNAVASLPPADPVANATVGTNEWYIPRAEFKLFYALCTNYSISQTDSIYDGAIAFAANVNFTFSPTNRAVPGKYDFIGCAEHELAEVMGRTSELDENGDGRYIPLDLFRFTNSGARSFNIDDSHVYFSVNNGTNNLKYYNDGSNGGDPQDWAASSMPDSYDAALSKGVVAPLSPVDLTVMNILGYKLGSVPQPQVKGLRLTNGTFQISFTNFYNAPFSVFASTDVSLVFSNWTYLGPPAEVTAGHYQFVDTLPNQQRFYRVRFP